MPNSVHKHRRRRTPEKEKRNHAFLATLCIIFALAVMTHFVFPRFSGAIGDKIDSITNYKAAFAALGEGISGERKFTEAFGEAWSLAFHPGRLPESEAVTAFNPEDSTVKSDDESITEAASEFSDAVSAGVLFGGIGENQ